MDSNSFQTTIQEHRSGDALSELSDALQEITRAVRNTGKPGTLKLTLKITPASKGSGRAVIVSDDISIKLPQLDNESSIFFATDDGALSRNDPDQRTLKLEVVTGGTKDEPLQKPAVNQ